MEARFRRYDEVILEKLRIVHVDEEKVVGEVGSPGELKELRDLLHQHNFWFSTRSVENHYENRLSIHWVLPKLHGAPAQGVALDDNAPFVITRVVNKDCRRGRAYWKRKTGNTIKEEAEDGEVAKVRKRKSYRTIKSDCPGKMTIRTIRAYPEFAVSSETSKKVKSKFAQMLKQAIVRDDTVGEERFVVSISRARHHCNHHSETIRDTPIPLHPLVARYVTTLVAKGNVASPKAIKALVAQFSRENFNIDEAPTNDRCYYPMVKDIRALLRGLVRNAEASEMNQSNIVEDIGVFIPVDQPKSKLFSPGDESPSKIFTTVGQDENKMYESVDESFGKIFPAVDPPQSRLFPSVDEPDCKIFASIDEPESNLITDDECEGIIDDSVESLVMEKIFMMSEGYLTLHFNQDPSEDNIATHVVSSQNSPCRKESYMQIQTVPDVPEDLDVISSDKFKLLTALERALQQVAVVDNPLALREALRCVEQASVVMESSINK